jgi:hypothetical protein
MAATRLEDVKRTGLAALFLISIKTCEDISGFFCLNPSDSLDTSCMLKRCYLLSEEWLASSVKRRRCDLPIDGTMA